MPIQAKSVVNAADASLFRMASMTSSAAGKGDANPRTGAVLSGVDDFYISIAVSLVLLLAVSVVGVWIYKRWAERRVLVLPISTDGVTAKFHAMITETPVNVTLVDMPPQYTEAVQTQHGFYRQNHLSTVHLILPAGATIIKSAPQHQQ